MTTTQTERGTALSWFLSGTLVGPAFGPFIGGIIVTFRSWRDIFWLQTALGGFGCVLILFFLPETTHYKRSVEFQGLKAADKAAKMWQWTNPFRVLRLYRYPNLITVVSSAPHSALRASPKKKKTNTQNTRASPPPPSSGTCTRSSRPSATSSTRAST